jgi:hypothetical protein
VKPFVSGIAGEVSFVSAASAVFTRLLLCCWSPLELNRVVRGMVVFEFLVAQVDFLTDVLLS